MRAEKTTTKRDPNKHRRDMLNAPTGTPNLAPGLTIAAAVDQWQFMPPVDEIVEAVNNFTRHYFQLGFIPKQAFPEQLRANHMSVPVFLLLGILSISARFTPSLARRYGSGMKAAETFMERASAIALHELYATPNLERCQGFYLLSIAQQGSGLRNSYINLGIAVRMATLMRLHREETYSQRLTNPTGEFVRRAEAARRTLWMLHSQDNLHSGPSSPVSLSASDITVLLPGDEDSFAAGREPETRAALAGTPPAVENPKLVLDPKRSLFATLIQSHDLWGQISRRAVQRDKSERPWESDSEFAKMERKLNEWERSLPHEHLWGPMTFHGYKRSGQDLAYLAVTNVTRLCNIIIRKAYLANMIQPDTTDQPILDFWSQMSTDLFSNVKELFDQIDTQFKERSPGEGTGAQMSAFCVYSCGIMATYLLKYPHSQ